MAEIVAEHGPVARRRSDAGRRDAGRRQAERDQGGDCGDDQATTDEHWRPDWRVELLPEYKAQRVALTAKQIDEWVEDQTDIVLRVLKLARVTAIGAPGCEAEDVIATIAKRTKGKIAIISGDRDLF